MDYTKEMEERFGYSEEGTVNIGTKLGFPMFCVCLVVMIIGVLLIDWRIVGKVSPGDSTILFKLLCAVLVCAVWVIVCVLLMSFSLQGVSCKYRMDREKLTINCFSKERTFYYTEVKGVVFEDMTAFGKCYAQLVTIATERGNFEYILSNAKGGKHNIFSMLAERAKRARNTNPPEAEPRPEMTFSERFDEQNMQMGFRETAEKAANGTLFPEISNAPEMNNRADNAPLFSDNPEVSESARETTERRTASPESEQEMPSLSLSSENAVARLEAMLSPLAEESAPPADIRADEKVLLAEGVFRTPYKRELLLAVAAVVGVLLVVEVCVLLLTAITMQVSLVYAAKYGAFHYFITLAITIFLGIAMFRLVMSGTDIRYTANGREFVMTNKKGETETLYICDIENVTYRPLVMLGTKRGYIVTVQTKYRTIKYKWLSYRATLPSYKDTPFYVINNLIEKRNNKDEAKRYSTYE